MTGKKRGRKGEYHEWLKPSGLKQIREWAEKGRTNKEIADNLLGVAVSTLYEWQNKFEDFSDALKAGKVIIDDDVKNSLVKRAIGMTIKEVKTEVFANGEIKTTIIEKEIPPETEAMKMWLYNRCPEEFKNKQNLEHTGKGGGGIKIELAGDVKEWAK